MDHQLRVYHSPVPDLFCSFKEVYTVFLALPPLGIFQCRKAFAPELCKKNTEFGLGPVAAGQGPVAALREALSGQKTVRCPD
jgi:hypothetical protein